MKKRILLIALALLMILSTATACVKPGGNSGKTGSDEAVTIELGCWPSETQTEDIKFFESLTERFNEKYPKVTVKPAHYEYATDSFTAMIEAETVPTIFETWYTEPQKLINSAFVKDITDVYKERNWTMDADVQAILSNADGAIFGIPRDAYVFGIHCNKTLFEEAGLVDKDGYVKAPKTWEELAETAKKIKDETGKAGLVILAADAAGGWQFCEIAWCYGADFEEQDADGKWKSYLNSKEVVAAMQYVYDLKWKYDCINDDPLQSNWGTGFEDIYTAEAAMYMAAQDAIASQYTTESGMKKEDLAVIAIPEGPAGTFALLGGTPYMFPRYATDDQVNAVFDFLEIWGKVPTVSDDSKEGMKQGYETMLTKGCPIVKQYNVWTNEDYVKVFDEVYEDYANIDEKDYQTYLDMMGTEGTLRPEEPQCAQDMYTELTNVLQKVLTDKGCDIQGLLDKANDNFQKILDEKVNSDL
jgi:ABC-type glycerol-3-phosphate transport system substrate-binding protein